MPIDPQKMQKQSGNDCKLIAMAEVLRALQDDFKIQTTPLPARNRAKNPKDQTEKPLSLRQLAKTLLAQRKEKEKTENKDQKRHNPKDQITEAIDDPGLLAEIAMQSNPGIYYADFIDCKDNEEKFFCTLTYAKNHGLYPMVFFDVDPNTKQPIKKKGKQEHAAIVSNITSDLNNNITSVDLVHWQHKITVDGATLFASSNQLREEQKEEKFYKKLGTGAMGWIPES